MDELVEALEARGFLSHNVYRAIRGLRRVHEVGFSEHGPGRAGTRVSLPQPAAPLSNKELIDVLSSLDQAKQGEASPRSSEARVTS